MVILTSQSVRKLKKNEIEFKNFYLWLTRNRRKVISGIRYLIPEEDHFFEMFRAPNLNIDRLIETYKKYIINYLTK